jgi:hypothetical protein
MSPVRLRCCSNFFIIPKGDSIAIGNLLSGAFQIIVGSKDAFSQIQRKCLHP